jgi:quinol monooxygenase YgiN
MYMRVIRARIDPARIDQTVSQVGQEVAAAASRLPGCQSYVGGVDRANGRTIAVSTWDTEEHARFSPDALGDIPSRLQALGLQIDPPEIFEVTT